MARRGPSCGSSRAGVRGRVVRWARGRATLISAFCSPGDGLSVFCFSTKSTRVAQRFSGLLKFGVARTFILLRVRTVFLVFVNSGIKINFRSSAKALQVRTQAKLAPQGQRQRSLASSHSSATDLSNRRRREFRRGGISIGNPQGIKTNSAAQKGAKRRAPSGDQGSGLSDSGLLWCQRRLGFSGSRAGLVKGRQRRSRLWSDWL